MESKTFNNFRYKGVMDIQSTNNVEDKILVSCGNDDDSRILVHNIDTLETLFEYKRDSFGFYKLNIIIFDSVSYFTLE